MTWGEFFGREVLPILATLLIAALTTLISLGAAYLRRRWQLDVPARLEEQLAGLTGGAVSFAEQWARTWAKEHHGIAPIGSAKLEQALTWAAAEAKRRGLPELARAALVRLIESQLGARWLGEPVVVETTPSPSPAITPPPGGAS